MSYRRSRVSLSSVRKIHNNALASSVVLALRPGRSLTRTWALDGRILSSPLISFLSHSLTRNRALDPRPFANQTRSLVNAISTFFNFSLLSFGTREGEAAITAPQFSRCITLSRPISWLPRSFPHTVTYTLVGHDSPGKSATHDGNDRSRHGVQSRLV